VTTDPRTVTDVQVGSSLRDAAVDPQPVDYLPPTNAGEPGELGNPHGPTVISPEIHGSQGMHPVTPGDVSGTAATQEAAETAHMLSFQAEIASLAVTPAAASVVAGATEQLTATATLLDTTTTQVVTGDTEWTTSDEAVATVDAAGMVTAVAVGSATITGAYRGETDTAAITVTAA
jgi:uncharacterized protein YjdB